MVATITAGAATRLTVGGIAVLLETLKGTTFGTPAGTPAAVPPGTLSATANQNRLTAI
jgi:ABC-type dipeptide/oligopeptide/nickel transport system permease subunit